MENTNTNEHEPASFRGQLTNVADALRFMTAGKATITLVSKQTGTRFTYKLTEGKDHTCIFVALLSGSDNESNYKYIGRIAVRDNPRAGQSASVFYAGRRNPRPGDISKDAPSVHAFYWTWSKLQYGELPASLEIWHEGICGRCGRKLTVPQSVKLGFGPDCAAILGLESARADEDLAIELEVDRMLEERAGII